MSRKTTAGGSEPEGAASGAARLARALAAPRRRPAICAYLTAGFPSREGFAAVLQAIASEADVVEIGVPFSDPMADGVTIQRASARALAEGVTLRSILDLLDGPCRAPETPRVLMSYLNPLLAFGFEALARRAAAAGVDGFVVPDLPLEECGPLSAALDPRGLALVQLVTPATPPARMRALCAASRGFVYAVTVTGTTGAAAIPPGAIEYLGRVRACASLPVLAGFGVREPSQVAAIAQAVDGVVVGSALIEEIEEGRDPVAFLRRLRGAAGTEARS